MMKAILFFSFGLLFLSFACSPVRKVSDSSVLNGAWELQRIGNTAIDEKNQERGVPSLDLNVKESRATGFGGCNRFFGSFTIAEGKISFGLLGSTKMACMGPNVEDRYLSALSKEKLTCRISKGELFLGEGSDGLVFKKAG